MCGRWSISTWAENGSERGKNPLRLGSGWRERWEGDQKGEKTTLNNLNAFQAEKLRKTKKKRESWLQNEKKRCFGSNSIESLFG